MKTKKKIFSELRERGIGVNLHYIPVHTQPYYQSLGFKLGDYPVAEAYYNSVITIPLFYGMTHQQQDYIADQLKQIVG